MFVSILIPCYNAERWIAQAIASALSQSDVDKEVIVVDDGSSDGSVKIIQSFGNRIRWETGPNQGGNPTRNRLLELSRGDWLQYLDADDYLLPHKVRDQLLFLEEHPDTDVVYSPVIFELISETGVTQETVPIPEPHDPWVLLARWFLPQTGGPLWRKQSIVEVGGWKPDQPCCQEHELYLRLLMAGKRFEFCALAGAVYRQWGEHTVCKRDKPEVHRRRLQIERQAEAFLEQRKELTAERLAAINQARFETARMAWQYSPPFAVQIMSEVDRTQHNFRPAGAATPWYYKEMYRWLGFRRAEQIADLKRNVMTSLIRSKSRSVAGATPD